MKLPDLFSTTLRIAGACALAAGLVSMPAFAADKVKVGVFLGNSALPYYVAADRGYFKQADLETEAVVFATYPLMIQAMVSGDIDAVANLVTLEGANINSRRPGTAVYISINGQNAKFMTEQFIVRTGSTAQSLKDLKGTKLLSAAGPANIGTARAVLAKVGLVDGRDFTIQEQQGGVQVGALQAGLFDGGYVIEPVATVAISQGVARRLEAGVISTYLLERKDAFSYAAGGAVTTKFMTDRPDVAARYAKAWSQGIQDANNDPSTRALFVQHMNIAPAVAPIVPLVKFTMVKDLKPEDVADFQRFVDLGVGFGVVKEKVDVKTFLKAY
ncbi:ABC transporter substrate-binding protein [Variovorax saccharolyticus]|uniref:ABC transporter substrate-binding protein n=1 Tax=Variovorax saccharolyticus TaxID=3053516 RepID=UPI002578CA65|nr:MULTISPECIES: ABC transporter substrate-binding protein [unclassified Variovorax]MDM0017006.1 ABC transporter substrate-binding protein [Variovorax sp. J22R187]MDM0023556.1 ABC transporter substrate-binding protein [Variovorax sp. J31P216]